MKYEDKIKKALDLAKTLEDIDYIENNIKRTYEINRRTKLGRELTSRLLSECNKVARKLIEENNLLPF